MCYRTERGCSETWPSRAPPSGAALSQTTAENKDSVEGLHLQYLSCIIYQKVTFDPVQPSRAKANWLMGDTTRSTLTALHGLRLARFVDSLPSSLTNEGVVRLHVSSGVSSVSVSVCFVPCFASSGSLKMEKHLSKRSMLEEGRAGPSFDSR